MVSIILDNFNADAFVTYFVEENDGDKSAFQLAYVEEGIMYRICDYVVEINKESDHELKQE